MAKSNPMSLAEMLASLPKAWLIWGMALFGTLATLKTQLAFNEPFVASFAYLDDLFVPGSAAMARLRSVPVGETLRVELAHGAFALEQAYVSKVRAVARMESHRKYIDIQVVVDGAEALAVTDVKYCIVSEDQTPAKDLIFYRDVPGSSLLQLLPGEAAIFFPADAHMPGLSVDKPMVVRKTVIKVPVLG